MPDIETHAVGRHVSAAAAPGGTPRRASSARGRGVRVTMPARTTAVQAAVFGVGLVAAVAAGIVAYERVGVYGDGPFSSGFRRVHDPETGLSVLVHDSRGPSGAVRRLVEGRRITGLSVDTDADGQVDARARLERDGIARLDRDSDNDGIVDTWEYYDRDRRLTKVGFSLGRDGIQDAWAYYDGDGQISRVEVSTKRDERIDRWEYYEDGRISRVDEDGDGDGRPDRRSTYTAGVLTETTPLSAPAPTAR